MLDGSGLDSRTTDQSLRDTASRCAEETATLWIESGLQVALVPRLPPRFAVSQVNPINGTGTAG